MDFNIKKQKRTSPVVQWLGICLLMQQTLVQSLVWDDSTCGESTKHMCRDYWACALGLVLHKRSHCKRKSTHCNESGLPCCNYRKSACSNKDPAQPKLKLKKKKRKKEKKRKVAKESWASWNVNNQKNSRFKFTVSLLFFLSPGLVVFSLLPLSVKLHHSLSASSV